MQHLVHRLPILLVWLACGCEVAEAPVDAAVRDGGARSDGAPSDAGPVPRDGASTDAGTFDPPPTDVVPEGIAQRFLSPEGDDAGPCTREAPCRTFERGVAAMAPGEALILLDGTYTVAVNGSLDLWTETYEPIPRSGLLPSGLDSMRPTVLRADNPGRVHVEGALRIGTSDTKVRHLFVYGVTFHAGGSIQNGDENVIKACGFEGGLGIGSIDHDEGCVNNVVEDVWVFGRNVRHTVTVYRAHHNTLRRVLVRGDGCDELYCGWGPGNHSAGITVYNSHDTLLENVVVMDRVLGANRDGGGYADFSTAQHESARPPQPEGEYLGRNQWLGCMSLGSEDVAMVFEADAVETGTTATLRDFVALDTAGGAVLDPAHRPFDGISVFDVDGLDIFPRVASETPFHIGCDVVQSGDPGCAHSVMNVRSGAYSPGAVAIPELRYGTSDPLFPWPNEARIKAELCATVSRGLCGFGGTLSEYIHTF